MGTFRKGRRCLTPLNTIIGALKSHHATTVPISFAVARDLHVKVFLRFSTVTTETNGSHSPKNQPKKSSVIYLGRLGIRLEELGS